MEYGPEIPAAEHEVFSKPPLKAMLGQVRYPPILKVNDPGALAGYQDAIRDQFPEFSPEQQFNLVVGPAGPANASVANTFRFSTPDLAWSIVLAADSLTLEVAVAELYTNYGEFMDYFAIAWTALLDSFRPARIVRQGLRYVDHIEREVEPGEWSEYINPDLLGPVGTSFSAGLEQAVSELRFRREDGALIFKHGITPAGPEGKKGYLLDFDYFTEEVSDDVSLDAVRERFDRYHDLQYAFFRWCVTESAVEEFRGVRT
jgi:uncharacterized protein (TIGR04255 family)